MSIPFSEKPGRHERHYRRRLDNPLFTRPAAHDDEALLEAQRMDHDELLVFISELRAAVERAVGLEPRAESEVVLALKEDLERLYETAAGVADEQQDNQQAIVQLLAVIMRSVRANAGADALAAQELDMEEQARELHFDLLREPLVADLLHPETAIDADDLLPTLLSETESALAAALQLFDDSQRAELAEHGRALLEARDPERHLAAARERLAQIERSLSR